MMRGRFVLIFALAACGDNLKPAQDQPDAAVTPDAPSFAEAAHPNPPQVQSEGGPVLAAPVVVPIFFAGDDAAQAGVEDFLPKLAASSYWTATTHEYGVGALTIQPSIVSTDTPPTTDSALQTWLQAKFPNPDPSTIYTVFLPAGVVLSQGTSAKSCVAFDGYHGETQSGLVYALLPRCTSMTFTGPLDIVTIATSHELIEASTDPHPFTAAAYDVLDADHLIWNRTPGGELGDMCEYVRAAFQPLVGNYLVQRTWSNASAAAGHDPCVPALATPYQGAALALPPITITSFGGTQLMTTGITANLGTPAPLEIDLFTDAPAADYGVELHDTTELQGGAPRFTFQFDNKIGNNGSKLNVMVTRTVAGTGRSAEIVLWVKQNNQIVSQWWGLVAGQ